MPTNTSGGSTTSFMNTPQAVDDFYNVYEDCIWTFDVMANDLGGNAKILWSIDDTAMTDDSGNGTYDLLKQDAALVPELSDLGARIWIESGKIRYDASKFNYLGDGQSATDHFTYAIRMANGTLSWATVTVRVDGKNDGPDIRVGDGDTASAMLSEGNSGLCKTGTLTVTDPDNSDTISTTIALTSATGPAGGLTNTQLLDMLKVTPATGLAADSTDANNLTWKFDSGSEAFNYLRAGQTLQLVYTLTVNDGHGGTDIQTVTLTITGTNDAPVLSDTTEPAAVIELGDASAQDLSAITGNFSVTDLDNGDTLTPSVVGNPVVQLNGGTISLPAGASALTAPGAFSLTGATSNGGAVNIGYNYNPAAANLDFLRAGDSLTITYTVQVSDGTSTSGTRDVTFTITGTNDAPVLTVDSTGSVTEDVSVVAGNLTDSGTLSIADVDNGDTHLVTSISTGVTWSGGSLSGAQQAALASGFSADGDSWDYSVANAAVDFLGAGETITLTFNVTVTDNSGVANNSDTESVTITITGTNDAPTIVAASTAGDVTEKAEPAEGGTLSDDGTITFGDVDLNDTHSASVGATVHDENGDAVASPLGSLTLGSVDQTANSVGWTFNVADGAVDFLAAGETRTQVYTITISDGHPGGTVTQDVTITITGTNDKPTITSADDSGGVTENGTVTASGSIGFADVDLIDVHTADFVPGDTGYLGTFSVNVDNYSTGDGSGQVGWDFSVDDADIQYLAEGQQLVQTYTVTVDDGEGGTVDQLVTITITGTNDDPDIRVEAGDSASATLAEANGTLTTGGTLTVTDVDTADTVSTAIALTGVSGNQGSLSNATLLDMLSVTPDSGLDADSGSLNNITWTFDSEGQAFNYLAAGQSLQLTYALTVSDGHGGEDTQTVTVTITGTNDAPVLTGDLAASIDEGGSYVLTTADLNFTDPDDSAANVTFTATGLSNGTLYVNGIAGNSFTGAQLAAGLVSFTHDGSETTSAGFSVSVEDGNEDASAPVAQAFSFAVTPVNDAPLNTVPGGQSVDEDHALVFSTGNGNAISIADADAGSGNVEVTLSVASGTLTLGSLSGLTVTGGANGSSTVTVQGTLADINAGLQGLTYQGNLNFYGGDSLSIATSDLGNSGLGGAMTDNDSVAITVNAVNDAPVAHAVVLAAIAEDSGGRLITQAELLAGVSDVDGPPATITALSIATGSGSLVSNGNGTWTYTPALNDDTSVTFNYTASDGSLSSSSTATLDITPVNDAPVNTLPATFSTTNNAALKLAGLSVSDVDAGAGNISVLLSVATGTLSAANSGGVTVSGSGTGSITLSGTLLAINTYLGTVANQPTFTPVAGSSGTVTLTMSTSDNGNTGSGGALIDTDTSTITVTATNQAPITANDVIWVSNSTAVTLSNDVLLANDTDPDGLYPTITGIVVASGTLGGSGAVTLNPNGTFSFTTGATGGTVASPTVVTLTYTVIDNAGGNSTGNVTLRIVNTNDGGGGDNIDLSGVGSYQGSFIDGKAGNDTLTDGAAISTLIGGAGNDTLNGNLGSDLLIGADGNDTLNGGAGNDILRGGTGNDDMDGGAGAEDLLDLSDGTAGVTFTLVQSSAMTSVNFSSIGLGSNDRYMNIEGVIGTNFNDTITGSSGNDILRGGGGNDILDGGAGTGDLIDFSDGAAGITFNLVQSSSNTVFNTGAANLGTDTYRNMEGVIGTSFNDTITGSSGNDILRGGGGNDIINGGAGDDIIVGGAGADTLTGGLGNDTFVFNAPLNAVDTITDFEANGVDRIQFDSAIFTQLNAGALSAANFASNAGGSATDANDYILFDTLTGNLYYDADGNGAGAKILIATLTVTGGTVDPTDFLIV